MVTNIEAFWNRNKGVHYAEQTKENSAVSIDHCTKFTGNSCTRTQANTGYSVGLRQNQGILLFLFWWVCKSIMPAKHPLNIQGL